MRTGTDKIVEEADENSPRNWMMIMCDDMPQCPYGCKDCPGSSDEAWVYFDEDAWALDQWMCPICRSDFRIANNIRLDDDDDYQPSEEEEAQRESEEDLEPAF